jgi:hypothetical protein
MKPALAASEIEHFTQEEVSFRRGYCHGLSAAIDALQAACDDDACVALARFFDDSLTPWRYAQASWEPEFPPHAPAQRKER